MIFLDDFSLKNRLIMSFIDLSNVCVAVLWAIPVKIKISEKN